jgi:molybdopterin adenylyltransferase
MDQVKILAVNISEKKGTVKTPVSEIEIVKTGVSGDAHAGVRNREVSLLGSESIKKMEPTINRKLNFGEFAENITTEGYLLYKMKPLDRLKCGNVELEVTQIGKKCHGERCEIFRQTGDCLMPKEGIFCRVISGGVLKAGDILQYDPKTIYCKIITLSDRASSGEYEDKSGPLIAKMVASYFQEAGRMTAFENILIPDDAGILKDTMNNCLGKYPDIIITTGGTGIGRRDITPDVIKPMLDKDIPGIMEMIRVKYGMQFPNALISRSFAGVTGNTLIYGLPGNPKAVREYLDEILGTVEHSLLMLYDIDKHS